MVLFYGKCKSVTQVAIQICADFGKGVVTERNARKCFVWFIAGDFSLEEQEKCASPPSKTRLKQ